MVEDRLGDLDLRGARKFERLAVPRDEGHLVIVRIQADLGNFELTVLKDGEVMKEIPIAVAADNTPTPGGLYYITELVQTPDPGGVYGPYAYGLSGFSEVHQSFNGGPGQLGIHGTNQPQYIGQQVSNGCIRMANADITELSKILPLGVPVEVIA